MLDCISTGKVSEMDLSMAISSTPVQNPVINLPTHRQATKGAWHIDCPIIMMMSNLIIAARLPCLIITFASAVPANRPTKEEIVIRVLNNFAYSESQPNLTVNIGAV